MIFLDENKPVLYEQSSFRYFCEDECHISRICNYSVMVLVYDGILRFNENEDAIEVMPGEYYIQREGLHQSGPIPSTMPRYFYIHFKADYNSSSGLPIRGKWTPATLKSEMQKLDSFEKANENLLLKSQIFYTILKELDSQNNRERKPLAEKIMHEIQKSYRTTVKLSEIASNLFISENHLIAVFRDAYGITPYKHVTDLRLTEAYRLLHESNRNESDIARYVGFSEPSVFFKAFKKKYGMSPSRSRRCR